MEKERSINANTRLQPTHFFIYREKKFPFNMQLFKCFSQYFQMNNKQFNNTTDINILDDFEEYTGLTESTINDFIDFCQSKNITLSKENAPFLHKMAKKYIVPLLIDFTDEFIQIHQKEVVIDLILYNQKDEHFDTSKYETMISQDLPYYINDDKLLLLPIQALHRIMTKYQQKKNDQNSTEIIEFLFKCLDKFGRNASVLFEQIDVCNSKNNALNRLLFEYSDKFDFHFINNQFLKTVYQLESEMIEKAEKLVNNQSAHNKEIKNLIQKHEQKIKEKDDQIQQKQQEIDRLIKQQEQRNNENDAKIASFIQQQEQRLQQIQSDFRSQLDSLTETVRQLTNKVTEQKSLIYKLNKEKEEMKKPILKVSKRFSSESDPGGIISILGQSVTVTSSASDDPSSYPISSIMKNDSSSFINYNYIKPKSESDTYIVFDFGSSRKIDLYSYFISSAGYNPKSWRIEGSNDQNLWKPLDRRVNDQYLKNGQHRHHYVCQEARHGNDCYRFIRYAQQDSWCNGDPYRVFLYFFELYGDVYDN